MKIFSIFVFLVCFLSSVVLAGEVELKWNCPLCVSDGVAAFAVRYGQSTQLGNAQALTPGDPSPYEQILEIADASARSAVIMIPQGLWYFSITALDAVGNESLLSSEVGVRVPISMPSGVSGELK